MAEGTSKLGWRAVLEEYGTIAVVVILVLFAIEMVVLVTLLRMGVDFQPFIDWVQGTFGWDVSGVLDAAGTFGIAYAITRVLKPFQLALAAVLVPIVARFWHRGEPPGRPPQG